MTATPEPPAPTLSATTCASCGGPRSAEEHRSGPVLPGMLKHRFTPDRVPPASAPAATAGTETKRLWCTKCQAHYDGHPPKYWCPRCDGERLPANSRPAAPAGEEAETTVVLELCGNGHRYGRVSIRGALEDHGCPYCLRAGLTAAREERETYRRAWIRSDADLDAQATELAALRARVEEVSHVIENLPRFHCSPHGMQSYTGGDWISRTAALLAARAALAPRQTTGDEP